MMIIKYAKIKKIGLKLTNVVDKVRKKRSKIRVFSNFQDKVWSASSCFLFKFLKHMFCSFSVSKLKLIALLDSMQSWLVGCEQVSINPLLQSGDLRLLRSQQVSTGEDLKVSKSKKEKGNILFYSSMRF